METMCNIKFEEEPLVSIVIPVYNGAEYLGQAINSALAQTYKNIEVVVVNDGSSDGGATENVAKAYGERIRYFSKPNGGVASALNLGISQMRGRYLCWLSHDDLYLPNKVEEQIRFLNEQENKLCIVFSAYKSIDGSGHEIQEYHMPERVYSNIAGLLSIETEYTLNGCTMLIPAEILKEKPFDESLRYTQDYDLWLKLSEKTEFVYQDKCLFMSRQHPGQDSRSGGQKVIREADRFRSRSVSKLSVQDALAYVEGSIGKLEAIANTYRVNGYEATYISISALIARCKALKANSKPETCFEEWIGIYNKEKKPQNLLMESEHPTLVIYSNVWTLGGIERVMSILMKHFCKNYRVVLVSNYVPNEVGYPLPDGVMHITLKEKSAMPVHYRIAAVCQMMNASIFIGNPNIVEEFLPVYALLARLNVKTVALNHYYYYLPYRLPWLKHIAELRHGAFEHADVVLWLTKFNAMMCGSRCDHVGVIANPNTFEKVSERTVPSEPVVLAVGRFFDSLKRIDRVLDVFGRLYRIYPEAKLVIVGEYHSLNAHIPAPVNMSIKDALAAAKVPDSAVIFAGEQKDVRPYYEQASVLLMTSDCEGFGMVLTEAGVYGVPTVVYGTPGLEDIIADGENGYVVPEHDPDLAAKRIEALLSDPDLWMKVSRQAQKLAERFSMENVARKWDALFELLHTKSELKMGQRLREAGLMDDEPVSVQYLYNALKEHENMMAQDCVRMVQMQPGSESVAEVDTAAIFQQMQLDETYRREVEAMQASFSWRITKPLRMVKALFRRRKR